MIDFPGAVPFVFLEQYKDYTIVYGKQIDGTVLWCVLSQTWMWWAASKDPSTATVDAHSFIDTRNSV